MKIGFIGNGWRTEGYLRVMKQVPEKFEVSGILFRDPVKAAAFDKNYPGKTYTDIDTFLKQDHDMIFVLLPREVVLSYVEKVLEAGFPLLLETPPADGVEQLVRVYELNKKYNAKIQVAEQYFLMPYHEAVYKLVDDGVLGEVSNLRIAMCHDYHGISLMRRFLGTGMQPASIIGREYHYPVLDHISRAGLKIGATELKEDARKVAVFQFENGKTGFFDFAGSQYSNYFRTRHMNVQGTHGEINDYDVVYWNGEMPAYAPMLRQDTGKNLNLGGYFQRGISWNGKFIYENPFLSFRDARLKDDEIAMAAMLLGMERLIETGEEIYPLKEALQDTYLYLMMDEAIRLDHEVRTEVMPWMED